MNVNTLIEVVHELIGEIEPVGETRADNESFNNLEKAIGLCEQLLEEIEWVSRNDNRPEYSMSRSGKIATQFLRFVAKEYEDK